MSLLSFVQLLEETRVRGGEKMRRREEEEERRRRG